MKVLHVFYPAAQAKDWRLIDAGIRVQAIKKTDGLAGIVHYGTEVITDADHSISALLGASPGASVSVNIILEVIKKCFPHLLATPEGPARMKEMIPTYDEDIKLLANARRFQEVNQRAEELLGLRRA
jgi:malate dehydrogenase (quinone)